MFKKFALLILLGLSFAFSSLSASAFTYDATTKSARMQVVADRIDLGSGPGTLEICTSGYGAVLATITLNDPSGTVSTGVLTLSGFPKNATATGTGTAAAARIKASDGTVIVNNLTVGTSGSDINLNSTSIAIGQTVTISSATFTHS